MSNNTIYIGGSFTKVTDGGTTSSRAHLAALDATSGHLLPWSPQADDDVYALAVAGNVVYAGGVFTHIDGSARTRLAAIDAGTGNVLSGWAPAADNAVRALAATSTTVYAGGDFKHIDSASRSRLAAISTSGQLDAGWTPSTDRKVYALALSPAGDRVYVGGNFTKVNGSTKYPNIAALDATSGDVDTSWNGQADFDIAALAADDNGVYAGGGGLGGHLVVWNRDGSLQQPIYQTDGGVQAVTVYDGEVYAGGHFTNYCVGNTGRGKPYVCTDPLPRRKLFSVDLSSGAVTDWNPAANSAHGVFALAADRTLGALAAGGDFTKIGSDAQAHFALFAGTSSPSPSPTPTPTISPSPTPSPSVSPSPSPSVSPSPSPSPSVSPSPSGSPPPPGQYCGTATGTGPGQYDHIVVIVYENKSASSIYGNTTDAPYLNSIADQCGRATDMNDLSTTSLTNYIAMTSGSVGGGPQGEITSNRSPKVWPQPQVSLFEQLGSNGRELAESMPSNCYMNGSGDFAVDHAPYQYYTRINKTLCPQQAVPLDVNNPDLSARYTMIIPNKLHDMHRTAQTTTQSARIRAGDQWTANFLPNVLNSPEYKAGKTVVILTWDEAIGKATAVPFIVISPYTQPGTVSTTSFNHYSLLKSTEQMMGMPTPYLGHANDAGVNTIQSDFNLG